MPLGKEQKSYSRYPFLRLLQENEAIEKGIIISDKTNHILFRLIQSHSTVSLAKQKQLFTLAYRGRELNNIFEEDVIAGTRKLLDINLITQIFFLNYENKQLKLIPCYIAKSTIEKGSPEAIYTASMEISSKSVEDMFQGLPFCDLDMLRSDMEKDFHYYKKPQTQKIQLQSITEPLEKIQEDNFDFSVSKDLLDTSIHKIQKILVLNGKFIEILHFGLMYVRKSEIISIVETADMFFQEKILTYYRRQKATLKNRLEQISLEEAIYQFDTKMPETCSFLSRKAEAIKNSIEGDDSLKSSYYPGVFCIGIILALANKADAIYRENAHKANIKKYEELKNRIPTRYSLPWRELCFTINEQEQEKIHTDTWELLINDQDLVYSIWEFPNDKKYLFCKANQEMIFSIISKIAVEPEDATWEILTFRKLLERHEKRYKALFEDPDFIQYYGSALQKAYIKYMPWYYKLFLLLKLNWFTNLSYDVAKRKILKEQNLFLHQNNKKKQKLKKEQGKLQSETLDKVRNLSLVNLIFDNLDLFYFEHQLVPTIQDIKKNLGNIDLTFFADLIKQHQFQVISVQTKQSIWESSILLYPINSDWHFRAERLKTILAQSSVKIPGMNQEMQIRFKCLAKHLGENESLPKKLIGESHDEKTDDPYHKFGEAVKKLDSKEKRKQDTDELPPLEDLENNISQ